MPFSSAQAAQHALGGNHTTFANKKGRGWHPVKDISGVPRGEHTSTHVREAARHRWQIVKLPKTAL